jgi:hypothetical protein
MSKRAWLLVGLGLALYYAAFVWRLSFTIGGARLYLINEDVLITMDYGRTLAQTGHLAWYPGGPGGGVSSLLWTLVAAGAWLIWPDPLKCCALIQVLNGVFWLLTLAVVYQAARLSGRRVAAIALALTATCWPLTSLFARGFEFSVVALGLALAYLGFVKCDWQRIAAGLGLCLLVRFPLPSTPMTLKLTGYPWPLMLTRGAWVEGVDLLARGFPVMLLAALGCWYFRQWAVLVTFATVLLFSMAVGGDVWHGDIGGSRWVVSSLPLVIVVAARMIDALVGKLTAVGHGRRVVLASVLALSLSWGRPDVTTLAAESGRKETYKQRAAMAFLLLNGMPDGARIAVAAAGEIPWLAPGKRYCDILGFNDLHIAREQAHRAPADVNPLTYYLPGHLKFDPAWTVAQYHPAVFAQVWGEMDFPDEWNRALADYDSLTVPAFGYANVIFRQRGAK